MSNAAYVERCLRQYRAHTRTRTNGDKVVSLGMGLYDLFSGRGWANQSRFRIVVARSNGAKQFIQVGGVTLSREYRNELLGEV